MFSAEWGPILELMNSLILLMVEIRIIQEGNVRMKQYYLFNIIQMKAPIFKLFLILSTFLILTGCHKENSKENISEISGINYYKQEDYRKALPLLEKAAETGSVEAALYLGDMYQYGKGVEQDFEISFKWYLKAAEKGDKESSGMVGASYYLGRGVNQDYKESLKWLLKSAEKIDEKNPGARDKKLLNLIMNMYLRGKGTLQDFSEAAKWAEKAAELGDANSQAVMAFLLYTGQGVLADRKAARIWAQKSADQGNDLGEVLMGVFNQYADSPDMKAAFDWYEKSAKQGNPAAQYQLGTFYEEGIIVPEDIEKAHACYKQAADSKKSDNLVKALMDFEARQKKQK